MKSANILLVDDSPDNLLALESVLRDLDQNLVRAASGEEALRRLLELDFALILLDVQMPGMDGLEAAALIRRRDRSRDTPIIFMTAFNKEDEKVFKGYSLGAVDYIFKPLVPEVLRAKVRFFVELYNKTETIKQQARELSRSNAELEEFAYAASHDLKEPLRKISGFIQLLKRKYADKFDAQAHRYILSVVDGVDRMQTLISDLLEYSLAGASQSPARRFASLRGLELAVNNLEPLVQESHGRVTHDPLPVVQVEPTQLVRVFQNLVGNALKFHGDQAPRVHVSARRQGEQWVFSIRDNGIGIPSEFHDRVFGLFKRLHSRDKYPGTGLGLAICKKIVEGNRGTIWVESEPGQGSTFHFTLPAPPEKTLEKALAGNEKTR